MNVSRFLLVLFASASLAHGETALDRKPTPPPQRTLPGQGRPMIPTSPFSQQPNVRPYPGNQPTAAAPVRPVALPTRAASGGLALSESRTGPLDEAAGGQGMKMNDLKALLGPYGTVENADGAYPGVLVYEGPRLDGSTGTTRVTYLMPLDEAENALLTKRGLATVSPAVAPGFPAGLLIHTYDIQFDIYNRLCLVTDRAKQVVSLLLKAQGWTHVPPELPLLKLEGAWHTHDYVNTGNRGQASVTIDTRIADRRSSSYYLIVNTTGGNWPPSPAPVRVRPAYPPKETNTWYVPQPLTNLILYSLSKRAR